MNAKQKANSIVTHELNAETGVITFHVLGVGDIPFNPAKVAKANRAYAEYHGWGQRIVDAAAIPVADKEGNIIPKEDRLQMKFDKMLRVVEHYESGSEDWELRVTGGGGAKAITVEAIARVKGVTYDEAVAMVERHAERGFGGDTKKALAHFRANSTKVQEAILAIQRERLPVPKVDADDALDELKAA